MTDTNHFPTAEEIVRERQVQVREGIRKQRDGLEQARLEILAREERLAAMIKLDEEFSELIGSWN